MFVFDVQAGGKQASSDVLTLIKRVEVKLVLDEEPAAEVRASLRSDATGEVVTATSNELGVIVFEEAALGKHTLFLET